VNGWVLEIAPNLHWVSSQVSELITGVIPKFKYLVLIYNHRYQKNQILFFIVIYNCSSKFSLKKTQMIILKLLVSLKFLKYPEPTVLRTCLFFQIPETDGYYRNQIPDPTLVWTGGCLVHSLAVSTISMGFTFGKRTPCYKAHLHPGPKIWTFLVSTFNQ